MQIFDEDLSCDAFKVQDDSQLIAFCKYLDDVPENCELRLATLCSVELNGACRLYIDKLASAFGCNPHFIAAHVEFCTELWDATHVSSTGGALGLESVLLPSASTYVQLYD